MIGDNLDSATPRRAWAAWARSYEQFVLAWARVAEEERVELEDHLTLEEQQLFPLIRERLSPETLSANIAGMSDRAVTALGTRSWCCSWRRA